jgi:hypothetical protein
MPDKYELTESGLICVERNTTKKERVSGVGSIGRSCRLQKVMYELRAEEYASKDEASSENPKEMERSLIKRSMVQASRWGCLEVAETVSITNPAPSLHVGVENLRLTSPDTQQ